MLCFNIPHACVLLLATWLGQEVVASATPQTHRLLRAATKRTDLYRRDVRITKKFQAEVGYVEVENGWTGVSTFASQVKVNSQKPILNLEEVEHHLQDVQCGDGTMKLSFVDASSARDAYHASYKQEQGGGRIVTSHEGCNNEGERSVYIVHTVSFADDGESLELSVTEALWQDAFDQFEISFGHTTDEHLFRRHADFAKIRKRQNFKVDIPKDTPNGTVTGTFDLSSAVIDTVFPAESFLAGIQDIVPIPELPIEIGCKNCSTRGRLTLNQGAIKIDLSQIDLIPDILQGGDDGKEIANLVSGGFIELVATGVGARIELFARPKKSGSFEVALFPIPILGFAIPGIGQAGASFEPRIAADFEITGGGFELTYGIDVTIPDNSNVRLELTNIAGSGVNGFPGSTLTPLPFNVNITDTDILLGLAFKPTIPIGFDFLEKLKADAFVSMNLPRLDARLSTNPGRDCGNSSNTTTPSAPFANQTTQLADNLLSLGILTLVEANISLTVDVGVGLTIPLLPPPFGDVNLDANIFSTAFPLITACVDAKKSFPSMTAIGGANATALPCTTTLRANSTVYVGATKTHALTAAISAAHLNSTLAAVMSVYTPATTHVVEVASKPANSTKAMHASSQAVATSHIVSMPAHASKTLSVSSDIIASTHVVGATSKAANSTLTMHASSQAVVASHVLSMPAHAVESKPASSHAMATSHMIEVASMPAHSMPPASHVMATSHTVAIASMPPHATVSVAVSSHIVEVASMPPHAAVSMAASSHVIVSMPAYSMPPPSHVMATTHTIQASSMAAHAPPSTSAHMVPPMIVSSHIMASTHIIEAPAIAAHTPSPMHIPSQDMVSVKSSALHNSTAATSSMLFSSIAQSTNVAAVTVIPVPPTGVSSPVVALPVAANSTILASGSGIGVAQQSGPAVFTGAGGRKVEVVWWKMCAAGLFGMGLVIVV